MKPDSRSGGGGVVVVVVGGGLPNISTYIHNVPLQKKNVRNVATPLGVLCLVERIPFVHSLDYTEQVHIALLERAI